MNIYPYVYRIDHPSGEFYIGYRCANTVPAEADFGHIYKTSTRHLSYPFEEYTQTILAEFYLPTGKDDAYDFEQALIYENWDNSQLVNKSYNINGLRFKFNKHSDEAKRKISEASRGKTLSAETKQKMVERWKQRPPMSAEHKRKLSEARQKRTTSEETKQKMSQSHMGKVKSDETRKRMSKPKSEEAKRNMALAQQRR